MAQFEDLLKKAKDQKEAQRLLFLFAKATSMLGGSDASYHSGMIDPIMCVDKCPEELVDFKSLVEEADSISKNWDFIFVSSFCGVDGHIPTSEEADVFLKKMSNSLASGADLSQYLIWDREEKVIIVS